MAEAIISPGVFQIESDQSLYTQAPQVMGAAIVGPTVGGRPFIPTYVTTYTQYQSIFGDVFKSGSYYYEYFTSMAAKEYFQNGGQTLLVTRIISGSANISTYAQANVTSQPVVGTIFATGSGTVLIGSTALNNECASLGATSIPLPSLYTLTADKCISRQISLKASPTVLVPSIQNSWLSPLCFTTIFVFPVLPVDSISHVAVISFHLLELRSINYL